MTSVLSRSEVGRVRMASLLLDSPSDRSRTALGVVEHFGAMQAQDAPGVAHSLGLRIGASEAAVVNALGSREIVRTWPMRGTLHLVASRDARWMLALMGAKMLKGAATRRASLGLDDEIAFRAVDVLAQTVADADGPVTRAACLESLARLGVAVEGQRGYHLLWFASQLGHLAGGPPMGKEQTFVSLGAWAPEHRDPAADQALALIASAYVRGHGPVDDRELARWTGLGLRESRAGLASAAADGRLVGVATEDGPAWVTPAALAAAGHMGADAAAPTRFLPGFDEFMLGYSERERAVDPRHAPTIVPGNNGVFKPTVVDRGRVVALWSRKLTAKAVRVTVTPLAALDRGARARVAAASAEVGDYAERPLDLTWSDA